LQTDLFRSAERQALEISPVPEICLLSVIGLLAAIAIPSFMKERTQSQQNACINNLRQIEAGKEQWALASK
jgi:Tfp pilus assembly protein PilE